MLYKLRQKGIKKQNSQLLTQKTLSTQKRNHNFIRMSTFVEISMAYFDAK